MQDRESKSVDWARLKPGCELKGTITRLELFGAFADIGAEIEGLIHISKLGRKGITRVQDVVQVGDVVDAWVERVDPAAKRLELTLIQPVALPWSKIKPGLVLSGKVTRLERFGAFVEIGAERPGLVHVSEMGVGYVPDPSEILAIGDEVRVTVLETDRRKKQIRLSMKSPMEELAGEAEEEELPTAMELALRQAMQASREGKSPGDSGQASEQERQRKEQEDLLARTLSQRVRTSSTAED